MKKIGVLFGMENTFPGALVQRINNMEVDGIWAEFVRLGAVRHATPCGYSVIVDRISHDMPFYRAYLKNAVLTGTHVINNPFWWSADDKFFNYSIAAKLGIAVPPTVLLPHKEYPPDMNVQSMRNLEYPLDWDAVFEYVGFPAYLKPHDGGGWRDVSCVHSVDEFFHVYDRTGDLCMTLQAAVDFDLYFRCYVVGQQDVRIMPYDPRRAPAERYLHDTSEADAGLLSRIQKNAVTLCRHLGYEFNTVEFAVKDGTPYAIDFMNPAPDADFHSVGEDHFDWVVDAVARLAVSRAQANTGAHPEPHAASLLANGSTLKPRKTPAKSAQNPSSNAPSKGSKDGSTQKSPNASRKASANRAS
jgi:hypothetical protein